MTQYNGPYVTMDMAYADPDDANRSYKQQQVEVERLREHAREQQRLERIRKQDYDDARKRALAAELKVEELREKLNATPPDSTEDDKLCKLCFEGEINAAFSCGHTSCYTCALQTKETFDFCAFCKQKGVTVMRLYQ